MDLNAVITDAGEELANELNIPFEAGLAWVSLFLDKDTKSGLFHIRQLDDGTYKSTGLRHILHNAKEGIVLDMGEAIALLGQTPFASHPVHAVISAILGGLFVARKIKQLSQLPLDMVDSAIVSVLTNHQCGRDESIQRDELLVKIRQRLLELTPFQVNLEPDNLDERLAKLRELAVVDDYDDWWCLKEKLKSW